MDLSLILASCFISLVGLPHGALDPVIAHRCGLIHDLRSSVWFFAGYIIVVALVVLFWLTLPSASLLLFLLISCIHFGRDWKQKVSFGGFAYGAFVLGLPAWTAPKQVEQIFSFLISRTHLNAFLKPIFNATVTSSISGWHLRISNFF